ncbi:MAG: radical SAM family heme chaperone HemW [Verrucomicrobiota bacterium]
MHLYVHIPFCHHICPYCGFYKHTPKGLAKRAFTESLLAEARERVGDSRPSLETIYFGGGTPSLLSRHHLELLGDGLGEIFDLSQILEWNLEANPATFGLSKAKVMREIGVNRISLGVQSFEGTTLQILGRDHTRKDAIEAFGTLRDAGFENVSIDLMFSIPGQTLNSWKNDLETAVELQPQHISAYNLTYEEDTEFLDRFNEGEMDESEDRDADLFFAALDHLESHGYEQYEISNYARPGHQSLHNQAYWSGKDYLGIGPGAVSTLRGERWKTLPDTAAYISAATSGLDTRTEVENLSEDDRRVEAIALQLRTRRGVARRHVEDSSALSFILEQGLLAENGDRLALTRDGKALADPIAAALV